MPLDFGLLQAPNLGDSFNAGRDAVVNQLAKQQALQLQRDAMLGQAEDRRAQAEDRRAQAEARRQSLLDAQRKDAQLKAIESEFAKNGQQMTPQVAAQMVSSGHPVYTQIGAKALEGFQSRQMLQSIMGGDTGMLGSPTAPAAPAAPGAMTSVSDTTAEPKGIPVTPVANALPAAAPAAPTNALMGARPAAATAPTVNALAPAFDIPAAQAKITRLLASGDPALMQVAHGLQAQVTAEQTRLKGIRDDERQRQRDQESLADRREARAQAEALRRELRAGRGDGGGPVTPVKVVDPNDPNKQLLIDARTGRIIGVPGTETEGLTAKEKQKREALYPKAKQAVATVESTMDTLTNDLETLANHPGLNGITGVLYGRTASLAPASRAAQALYDKIVARGGFSELQNMRAASPTGGALGNVSDREGAQLKQAFAEIGREQTTDSVRKALLRAAQNAKEVKARAREAFDDTYEYRTQGGGGTPAPAPTAPKATKGGATVSNW
jgi:hypothetical protein